jgi:hypothetical protein
MRNDFQALRDKEFALARMSAGVKRITRQLKTCRSLSG